MGTKKEGQRECSRCNKLLNKTNTNGDGLCGMCQQELAPHHENSPRYIDWVMRGKPKEISRTRSGKVFPVPNAVGLAPSPITDTLQHYGTNDLLNELARRRDEAERIISIFNNFKGK
jgi:hypothetical protein